ncbi:hypothetical protein [Actinomadura verrucosospora]|uniref:hypothetical protein n=1 Tax=Actinomadura verrucosospora TaxID=46165 RepID=UPI0015637CAB|nr:hypothetical protein [Actinomadura verrucosospora]
MPEVSLVTSPRRAPGAFLRPGVARGVISQRLVPTFEALTDGTDNTSVVDQILTPPGPRYVKPRRCGGDHRMTAPSL